MHGSFPLRARVPKRRKTCSDINKRGKVRWQQRVSGWKAVGNPKFSHRWLQAIQLMGQDPNSPRACFYPAPHTRPQKIPQPRETMHRIVPENKSKGDVKLEREQNPRARTNASFFFFYPKTDLTIIPTSTLTLLMLFFKTKNKQTKSHINNNSQTLSHGNSGQVCLGTQVAEWQREDGKRKQCEAASLKSVKKIKCEFDECEVWDILSKREGK